MDYIGIDAGGTWIKAGRFKRGQSESDQEHRAPSHAADGIESYVAAIVASAKACGASNKSSLGISAPGLFTADHKLRIAPNIQGLDNPQSEPFDLALKIEERLPCRSVVVENDANCAALAEWWYGMGHKQSNVRLLHLTLGTGVGTGFIVNGTIQPGWEGGHIHVTREKQGNITTLEDLVGVPQLLAKASSRLLEWDGPTSITEKALADATEGSKYLIQWAEQGDRFAEQIMGEVTSALAVALHDMALLVVPDLIAVGGALASSSWLTDNLRGAVDQQATGVRRHTLSGSQVIRAKLGNSAGRVGAALLAQQAG